MTARPFSIQAPEEVAKAYGGNKQKIMQAAQLGVVDPTAAVLAGMFIDRMRNSAQAEQATPPSIAQQVMAPPAAPPPGGPGGPPPGGPGGPPPGGLGGLPPGGPSPPMGGPGGPPPGMGPPPGGPPPGMARGGGLDSIPVHEGMFTGDYTEGGLVAFADGGTSTTGAQPDYGATAEQMLPIIQQMETGSGGARPGPNTPYGNAQGFYQILPSTAKGLASEAGIQYDPNLASANTPEGQAYQRQLAKQNLIDGLKRFGGDPVKAAQYYQGGPNQALWGKNNAAYATNFAQRWQAGSPQSQPQQPQQANGNTQVQGINFTPKNYDTSFASNEAQAQQLLGGLPTDADQQAKQYFSAALDPANIKKQKTQDMWSALAQLGGTLASTPGPFLSALGSSIAKTMPTITADEKDRRANQTAAVNGLMAVEGIQRKEAMDVFNFGKDMWEKNLTADQQQQLLAAKLAEIKQQGANTAMDVASRERVANIDVNGRIITTGMEVNKPSDTVQEANIFDTGTPGQQAGLEKVLEMKSYGHGSSGAKLTAAQYHTLAMSALMGSTPNPTADQLAAVERGTAEYNANQGDPLNILGMGYSATAQPKAGPPVQPRTALPQGWAITQQGG